MTSTVWYKATGDNGKALYGVGSWNLPTATEPGDWMPRIEGELFECARGYHFHDASAVHRMFGTEFYLAEPDDYAYRNGLCLARGGRLLKKLNWNRDIATQLVQDGMGFVEKTRAYKNPRVYQDIIALSIADDSYFASIFGCVMAHLFSGSDEKLWMRQRLLMYLHGGIA
jgi:hypothetical protein